MNLGNNAKLINNFSQECLVLILFGRKTKNWEAIGVKRLKVNELRLEIGEMLKWSFGNL